MAVTRQRSASKKPPASVSRYASVLEEARRTGLLDGDKSEHVSLRAPPALVEAAKREAGVTSVSELGVLALAMLAQPDPVAAFFRRTEGSSAQTTILSIDLRQIPSFSPRCPPLGC